MEWINKLQGKMVGIDTAPLICFTKIIARVESLLGKRH